MLLLLGVLLLSSSAFAFSGRVVNGTDANPGDFPYIVSFRGATGSLKCGGTIIGPRHILTAAHCLSNEAGQTIQYGTTRLSQNTNNVIAITQSIRHENYNTATIANDIAILVLASDIPFSTYAQPIALPEQDSVVPEGDLAVLAGWGRTATGSAIPDNLQKVTLQIYNYETCNNIHGGNVRSTNICAGVPGGYQGQCNGDSGGPLAHNNRVVGVVSWSVKPCTVPPYPGVYTRVAAFRNWIRTNSGI